MEWLRNIGFTGSVHFHWCMAINLRLITLPSVRRPGLISSSQSLLPSLISTNNKYLSLSARLGWLSMCMPAGAGTPVCPAQHLTHQPGPLRDLTGMLIGLGMKDGPGVQGHSWKKGPESPRWATHRVGYHPVLPGLSPCCSLPSCQQRRLLSFGSGSSCSLHQVSHKAPQCFIYVFVVI